MAGSSLQSASKYLNNLLLARGLLHDGKSIDFAQTAISSENDQTASRIINLVHDLVLRRDRDSEQREVLASNLRQMRAEDSQRVLDLQRVQDKNAELARNLTSAESQQRTLKAAVRKAESQAKELKEQMLKMKSTLDQVRAKCISDVRKRDVELEKLKSHLAGMQRGKREASGMKVNTINPQITRKGNAIGGQDVDSTGWSLEKETNDFLAAIVNETSTENVALRDLITRTMVTLRDLTGMHQEGMFLDNAIGIPGQYRRSADSDTIIPCSTLESQMTAILTHSRAILKDPSFVPIEEVQIRDEEIVKLRLGWEKMAGRWKEAVTMMNAWRDKMLDGDHMDANDLSDLSFGRSMAMLPNGEPVLDTIGEETSIGPEEQSKDDTQDLTHVVENRFDEDSELEIPPEPSPKRLAASPARRGIHLPTQYLRSAENRPAKMPTPDTSIDSVLDIPDENTRPVRVDESEGAHRGKTEKTKSISVAEKLAMVEADAKAAEVARTEAITHKRKPKPRRNDRARRRSTLSPAELAELMVAR